MRWIILLGGFLGFVLALGTGWAVQRPWGPLVRDAALASLAGAILLRWFWRIVLKAAVAAARERISSRHASPP